MKTKELEKYRTLLEGLIASLGREEVAVSEAAEVDGKLAVTLVKESHSFHAEIPLAAFADPAQLRAVVSAVLVRAGKAGELEHTKTTHRLA